MASRRIGDIRWCIFFTVTGSDAERYWDIMKVPEAADKDIAAGTAKEMILVHPDAFTIYNGSMYSSSPTTGDWETFIARGSGRHGWTAITAPYRTA